VTPIPWPTSTPSPTPQPTPTWSPTPTPSPTTPAYDPRKDPAYEGYKYRPGEGFTVAKYRLPPRPSCVKEVKSTIKVNGTFDGQGCLYTWKGTGDGKSYKEICFAPEEIAEGLPPMFELQPGATLRNVQIECALDGIHTTSNNTIENVIMRDVEEDAVTLNESVTIKNSQFWFCNDKCLQMNRANKATIENNKFYYVSSAILANYGRNVRAAGNFFYNTRRAIRSRTSDSTVVAEGNTHENGDCHLLAQDKGLIEDWGGARLSGVKNARCIENDGRIVTK
jgi:hypothetical protein